MYWHVIYDIIYVDTHICRLCTWLYTTWRHKLYLFIYIYIIICVYIMYISCVYIYICLYHNTSFSTYITRYCIHYIYIIHIYIYNTYIYIYNTYIYIYIYIPNLSQLLLPRHFRLPIPASADFPHVVPGVATAPPAQWRAAPLAVPGRRGQALRSGRSGSGSSAGARGNDAWMGRDGQSFTWKNMEKIGCSAKI